MATGTVKTLWVEAERMISGKIEPADGKVVSGSLADPTTDVILDDLFLLALNTGT